MGLGGRGRPGSHEGRAGHGGHACRGRVKVVVSWPQGHHELPPLGRGTRGERGGIPVSIVIWYLFIYSMFIFNKQIETYIPKGHRPK